MAADRDTRPVRRTYAVAEDEEEEVETTGRSKYDSGPGRIGLDAKKAKKEPSRPSLLQSLEHCHKGLSGLQSELQALRGELASVMEPERSQPESGENTAAQDYDPRGTAVETVDAMAERIDYFRRYVEEIRERLQL
jgi:hypothetical protein